MRGYGARLRGRSLQEDNNHANSSSASATMHTRLVNSHRRYQNLSQRSSDKSAEAVLVFIGITSGPHHTHLRHGIRNTWSLPCKLAKDCDYRFFVDAADRIITDHIVQENLTYNDMIFRSFCPLMNRHPYYINYGNSPPVGENLYRKDDNATSPTYGQSIPNPDYRYRRFYKIDWKICFFRYGMFHYPNLQYYVLVEDDSYVCTENLLYQFNLLYALSQSTLRHIYFRTGTPLYDGYDDSSTLMDAHSAHVFAEHYPSEELNCNELLQVKPEELHKTVWLSWGNSWRTTQCNWIELLQKNFHVNVYKPYVTCTYATTIRTSTGSTLELHCLDMPLVLHHSNAHHVIVSHTIHPDHTHARMQHVCEYMWLIDKMKDPGQMFDIWNQMTMYPMLHNFTALFLPEYTYDEAWHEVIGRLAIDEENRKQITPACTNEQFKATIGNDAVSAKPHTAERIFPCLFELNDTLMVQDSSTEVHKRMLLISVAIDGIAMQSVISYKDYFNDSVQ
ncbi:hypothetical protein EON65_27820 [archaeon]|nr:MAG: hypothetical protein EON65_27820 [archaeon]